jgi:hypothetical protein
MSDVANISTLETCAALLGGSTALGNHESTQSRYLISRSVEQRGSKHLLTI